MQLWAPDGHSHLLDYRDAGGRPALGLALARLHLDAALLEVARARGAEVCQGFRVSGLLRGSDGTVGGVLGDGGRRVRARLTVGADGVHSTVARALGLRARVRWPRRLGLVAHLTGVAWPEDHGQLHAGRRGYVGVAPLDQDGLVSVGLVMDLPRGRPAAADPRTAETRFASGLAEFPGLAERLSVGRRQGAIGGVGPLAHAVRACAGPGFLLVGDAAGFFDPFTGEGIFRALRGAQLAAEAGHAALHGSGDPSTAYAAARRREFRAKEQLTALIQLFVQTPALMSYGVARLRRRPALAARLADVLGDLEPAAGTVRAGYLAALLRP
jgi:flavin-dependent dehydrogenase